ncbi:histidine phosphatase family protein [Comamonas sp. 17RB]|uniref:histidine phosphatase family protein n=1 Tax=Comamonas sp. 17RB TaxID=3047025 RepID=UPI0024B740EE|nr:histidine phosphatase family protein [Comamonas sp. 17RB]MDI9856013.1 histidine phosphatase family protein [Comamonas sp. 17RB]
MSTLWLLRHAHPLVDAGVCYGRLDVAADAARTVQAAQDFSGLLPAGSVLRHSPLRRCVQLADALVAHVPALAPDRHPDSRLQEMDFGRWEGQLWEQISRPDIDAWAADLATCAPGGGESLAAMLQRVQQALQHSWAHDSRQGKRDVVWVTHAGVVRCVQWLQQHGNGLPTSAEWNLPAPGYGQWLALPWDGLAGMQQHL